MLVSLFSSNEFKASDNSSTAIESRQFFFDVLFIPNNVIGPDVVMIILFSINIIIFVLVNKKICNYR